jgi:hypothetical protein
VEGAALFSWHRSPHLAGIARLKAFRLLAGELDQAEEFVRVALSILEADVTAGPAFEVIRDRPDRMLEAVYREWLIWVIRVEVVANFGLESREGFSRVKIGLREGDEIPEKIAGQSLEVAQGGRSLWIACTRSFISTPAGVFLSVMLKR